MTHVSVEPRTPKPAGAWYRQVTRAQWMAFIGSYFGWVLDGFDYTILTFLLVDIQHSFAVNATLCERRSGDIPGSKSLRTRTAG
jgi:hypothetical protein